MVIRRIRIGSLARVAACLYGGIGLLVGIGFFLFSLMGMGMAGGDSDLPGWMAPVFGTGALIVLPLMYAVLGAAGVSVAAFFYNIAAGLVGGVEVEVDRTP